METERSGRTFKGETREALYIEIWKVNLTLSA